MNYTIYADNNLIYNKAIVDENGKHPYMLVNPTLNQSVSRFSSLTYKAVEGSPGYEQIGHIRTRIKVYKDGDLYWTGRVFSVKPTEIRLVTVTVEDFLGVLNDTIVRPYEWNGSAGGLLEMLIDQHNSQVTDSNQLIYAVVCDVTENVIRSSSVYDTTWTNVKTKLIDMLGGYMWIEYDSQERPVLYYSMRSRSQVHSEATQEIKFRKNIVSYDVDVDASTFYTACVPLGASYQVGSGTESDPHRNMRLTIADINNGKDYLVNETAAAVYGIIYAPVKDTTWDDVTLPSNLLTRGQQWLQQQSARYVRSISLSAVDISCLYDGVPEIEFLDSVQCKAPDFDEIMVIKTIKRDLGNPMNLSINIGDAGVSLSGKTASSAADTTNRITSIEADYVTNGEAREVAEETIENSSTIQQLPEQILTTVSERYTSKSEFEEYTLETATKFAQLPNEFQFLFTQVLSGAGLTELQSYLRILNGNLHLGKSDSEIKACLKNNILLFYTGEDALADVSTAVSYYDAGKLYVDTVQIQSYTIGTSGAEMDVRIMGEGDNICMFFGGRLTV